MKKFDYLVLILVIVIPTWVSSDVSIMVGLLSLFLGVLHLEMAKILIHFYKKAKQLDRKDVRFIIFMTIFVFIIFSFISYNFIINSNIVVNLKEDPTLNDITFLGVLSVVTQIIAVVYYFRNIKKLKTIK